MGRMRKRDALAALVFAVVSGLLFASPALDIAHGLSIDVLTALRWQVFGQRHDRAAAPVVVVVIDDESFGTPPFKGSPILTWTREIGRVLSAIIEGGAKVVGFDIIFPTLIEQSEIPFGDEMLGARIRGFDRDFLRALALGARADKVVLGEVLQQDQPIRPSPGQRIAVGHDRNIRALNTYSDPDYVIRKLPLAFPIEDKLIPSMSVELAARALGVAPEVSPDGTMTLAGYRPPSAAPGTMTLNFQGGGEEVPTYSFADLYACVEKGDKEFFRRQFDGKVVLFGTLLETEDRKVTSKRFATGSEGARAPRCALPMPPETAQFTRNSISGVYVHATGVNNLIRREALIELGRTSDGLIAIAFAGLTALAAIALAPLGATLFYLGLSAAWTAGATVAFAQALVLPLVEPFLAGLAALAATIGYRFVVADKEERFLRQTFGLYLAPQVIETMLASRKLPVLGGEMRNVTVFFSDIAGFSSFAETMAPTVLVALMNQYLSAMTDIIEQHGGYVDKYIGDSIVAVFGAPVDDADHACHAVRAALACRDRLAELNRTATPFQHLDISHRIGLNSGEALVGNIGSRRRFNYTVMSDAVNLASRLEGANKYFGTSILASEGTVKLTGAVFIWRELDAIRVKGRTQPVRIYGPVAERGRETPEQMALAAAYAEGLACWRARDFAGARDCFARIADADRPAALFLQRIKKIVARPLDPDWEPVFSLEGK
ncbi:MAG: adenylate/guanylate cyclase domain-containing protein [Rhodoplanes sp.]